MNSGQNLFFLFKSFFKIGITSFGGHAALVSVLQEELVRNNKIISEEEILDGLTIASILPGPLAVNVVTYIGYRLRGWLGAITSLVAVLLPPTAMIIGIAELYKTYSNLKSLNSFLAGVIPIIIGLILSLCYNLFSKHVSNIWQYALTLITFSLLFFLNSYLWIVLFILVGGISGYLFQGDSQSRLAEVKKSPNHSQPTLYYGFTFFAIIFIVLFFTLTGIHHELLFEFTKISLTLFGGGYVMIPILYEIVVEKFSWLSSSEFANAIAFGQITPGPILVSATYVGFVTGGVGGALLATIGIFLPSSLLMIFAGNIFESYKNHPIVTSVIIGIRTVIIALIAYSGWILLETLEHRVYSGLLALLSFLIIAKTKFNYFLLLLVGGILGILLL